MKKIVEELSYKLFQMGEFDSCSEYGEPGYKLPESKKAILLGDWNNFSKQYPNYYKWLEENYELEWIDEWIIDYDNDKCYRTAPDSYSWEKCFRILDGELITPDSDIEEWIEYATWTLDADNREVLPSFIEFDSEQHGFQEVEEEYEDGWYHRNDNPEEIAEKLFKNGATQVLFQLIGIEQFRVNFKVFYKEKEDEN